MSIMKVSGSSRRVVRDFTDMGATVCLRCVQSGDFIGEVFERGSFTDGANAFVCSRCDQTLAY
jgi:hypothetical protein